MSLEEDALASVQRNVPRALDALCALLQAAKDAQAAGVVGGVPALVDGASRVTTARPVADVRRLAREDPAGVRDVRRAHARVPRACAPRVFRSSL